MDRPKVFWIRKRTYTGEEEYNSYLERYLRENYDLNLLELEGRNIKGRSWPVYYTSRVCHRIQFFFRILKINLNKDIKIRDFKHTSFIALFPVRGKNITLVHHIDRDAIEKRRLKYLIDEFLFFKGLKKSDIVVTVAEYWRRYFIKKGYKDVRVAYNCYDIKKYDVTRKEAEKFKKKYHLEDKPIIYIGNCQRRKGVVEAYEALKDLDIHLVTSGKKEANIPATHLDLPKDEYLTLLKASSIVVTMSRFNEGWCRTAHEAMLLGTPVIGSGKGGMGELLRDGQQIVCSSNNLRNQVQLLINNKRKLIKQASKGQKYARTFDLNKFQEQWTEILRESRAA